MTQTRIFQPELMLVGRANESGMGGSREPMLFMDHDRNVYVGKSNDHHKHLVANEYVAFQIAYQLDMKIPTGFIYDYGDEVYFMSCHIEGSTLDELFEYDMVECINDPADVFQMICFDLFICNRDRCGDNMLFHPRGAGYDLYVVDHERALVGTKDNGSHMDGLFKTPCKWIADLDEISLSKLFIKGRQALQPYVDKIRAFPDEQLTDIIYSIQDNLLSVRLKKKLLAKLKHRRRNLNACVTDFFQEKIESRQSA